jgi:hypothetical protein
MHEIDQKRVILPIFAVLAEKRLPANVASVLRTKIDGSDNPSATPPGIQSIHFAAEQISLVVTGAVTANNTITATSNLANPQWLTLLTTNAPALPFTFVDTNTALTQRFYRVQIRRQPGHSEPAWGWTATFSWHRSLNP